MVWRLLCVKELKTFPTLLFSNFSIFTYLFHPKLNKVFKFLILVEIVRFAMYLYKHVPKKYQPWNIKMTSYKLSRKNHKQIHESLTHPRNFHIPFMMLFFFFSPKIEIKLKTFPNFKSPTKKTTQNHYLLKSLLHVCYIFFNFLNAQD